MSMFDLSPKERRKGSAGKQVKIAIGIFAMVGSITLGTTLASNIRLNGGGNVEFGQGVAQTVVCGGSDVSITITPESAFANDQSGGRFRFSGFKVTDIPSECNGVDFKFKFYGDTGTAVDPIQYDWAANGYSQDFNFTDVNVRFLGEQTTGSGTNNLWSDNNFGFPASYDYEDVNDRPDPQDSRTGSSFEVTFWYDAILGPGITTDELKKITVESSGETTLIGQTGPAGGVIFLTPEESGTPYFYEVAPADVSGTYSLCSSDGTRGLSNNVGSGYSNSQTLYADDGCNDSGNAAYAFNSYSYGGYTDWYLPSRFEMVEVRTNVFNRLSDTSNTYLTSSELSSNSLFYIEMVNPDINRCGHGFWTCTSYKWDGSFNMRLIRRWLP